MTFRNIKKLYVLFHWLTFESYIYKRNGVNQQRDYTSITICERMIFLQQWAIYIRFYMKYRPKLLIGNHYLYNSYHTKQRSELELRSYFVLFTHRILLFCVF